MAAADSSPPNNRDDSLDIWRWVVDDDDVGARLDRFMLEREPGPTRSQLKKLIDAGRALVDGAPARAGKRLRAGQRVELCVPPPEPLSAEPEPMELDIRYEDEALIVVMKPQGLVVHPAPGHPRGTLVNGLLHGRTAAGGEPLRPGIVHRLDKDTSGLMVVAKREDVHADLAAQWHARSVARRYAVLVAGDPPGRGEWRTRHGRHPRDRKRFTSRVDRGRSMLSEFERRERFYRAAELVVTLHTGRTHQVRVHCHDAGYGVLGDRVYGPRGLDGELAVIHRALPGQALHAELLGFRHPLSGEALRFEAEPPEAYRRAREALRRRA